MWSKNLGFSFPRGGSSGNPEWEMAPAKPSIVRLSEKSKDGQAPSAPGFRFQDYTWAWWKRAMDSQIRCWAMSYGE